MASEGLSPNDSKAEAENAAQLSVALVENAIVILMLVEDHLRLQSKLSCASRVADSSPSPLSLVSPMNNNSNLLNTVGGDSFGALGDRKSLSSESGLPLDVCQQHMHKTHEQMFTILQLFVSNMIRILYIPFSCASIMFVLSPHPHKEKK